MAFGDIDLLHAKCILSTSAAECPSAARYGLIVSLMSATNAMTRERARTLSTGPSTLFSFTACAPKQFPAGVDPVLIVGVQTGIRIRMSSGCTIAAMSHNRFVLAVDLGTSGCKCALVAIDGIVQKWAFRPDAD